MKKYIFISLALVSMLCACSREEESFFDQSAAERSQATMDSANAILAAAANGWEMIYFANTESRGYNIIVKFDENGRVKATAKNSITTGNKLMSDESTWEVKLDYGPILTFDTYNKVLHAWADPQEDGDGLLGDYEFLILSASAERVVLKGKKHSAYTILRPMPDMDYEEYYKQCNTLLTTYFSSNNIVTLEQGNKKNYLHNGASGLFTLTEFGAKDIDEIPLLYPICPTLDGFMMSYGFNDMKNERLYKLEGDKFVGENGSIISAGPLNQLFCTYIDVNKGWSADAQTITGAAKEAVDAFNEHLRTLSKDNTAKLKAISYTYSDTVNTYQGANLIRLTFEYKQSSGKKVSSVADYVASIKMEGDKIVVAYEKPATSAASTWYSQATVPELVNAATGTFSLAAKYPINTAKGLDMSNGSSTFVAVGASNIK